jgi:2,3-bisphosphoglycerate-dependent phosphoglycerate mutase/probable phosphoglycerate mutase
LKKPKNWEFQKTLKSILLEREGSVVSINFFLVRHAVKERAIGDVPITPEGIIQAQSTAQYFRRLPVSAIMTSPLRRTKETAEYIARETNTAVEVDARLRERANWGDLPGQSFEEFVEMWERCTHDRAYVPPFGDSARLAGERCSSLLSELAVKYPSGSNILAVTHGGLITDFLVNTLSEEELNVWHPDFVAVQSSLIPECSITKLIFDEGRYRMVSFASTEHLR